MTAARSSRRRQSDTASFGVIGISHRSSSLGEVGRSRLRAVGPAFFSSFFDEHAVLATCNRVEIYFRAPRARAAAARLLGGLRQDGPQAGGRMYRVRSGDAALRHLFAVASGIESLVVGETEILSQVRAAGRDAVRAGTCGPFLGGLFRDAVAFGRDIRRRTPISAGATSIADLAVAAAAEGRAWDATDVLILGAGGIATKVALRLMRRPPRMTLLVNRTTARAHALRAAMRAARPDAAVRVVRASLLRASIGRVGTIIAATSAPEPLVTADDVPASQTDLLCVDLGVPANIDPAVADPARRVRRVTIDDFRPVIDRTLRDRKTFVLAVRRAVAAAVRRDVVPELARP